MRLRCDPAHDVPDGNASRDACVGDHATMTAPPLGFGAHHANASLLPQPVELLEAFGKSRGLHIVGITAKPRILPAAVERGLPGFPGIAKSAKCGQMNIFNPGLWQRLAHPLLLKPWKCLRTRQRSNVHQHFNLPCIQKVEELGPGARGMADRKQRSLRHGPS